MKRSFRPRLACPLALFSVLGFNACSPVSESADPPAGGSSGQQTAGSGGSGGSRGGGSGGSGDSAGGSGGTASGGAAGNAGGAAGSAAGQSGSPGGSGGAAQAPDAGAGGAPGTAGPPTGLADFRYRKVIRMNTTASGAGVMASVPNYPVAVLLDATRFDFSQAKDGGEDIRFATMDGTDLPHAIESWDKAAGKALVWVKVPEVQGNNDTQAFRMHWGHAGAPDASNSQAVFDAKDGYLGVWHLDEDGSVTPDGYKDASGYGAHGTGVNLAPGSRVDSILGKGTRLQNSRADWKGQWIRVDGPKVIDAYNATAERSITVSAWARASSFPGHSSIGGYETVFSKGDTSWTLQKFSFNTSWESCTKAPGSGHYCAISRQFRTMTNVWFHFTLVITRSNLTQFINAVQDGRTGNAGRVGPHPFGIGQQTQSLMGKREWDGILDEVRVYGVAKDANWIKLEFESQKEGSKFLVFGETESSVP